MKYIHKIYKKVVILIGWYIIPFGFFRIDRRKIVISSYYNRGYSDSPKSIVDELLNRASRDQYRIICITDDVSFLPPALKPVRPRSLAAAYHMRTAKIWIDNCRKPFYVRKRIGQYYIQTWHGACSFKRVEADAIGKLDASYIKSAINDSKMCDLMISDSTYTTNLYQRSFWYKGEVLTCGLPRADTLVNRANIDMSDLRKKLGIPIEKRTVVYAPTFRSNMGLDPYNIDYARIQKIFEKKFGGEWVILLRLHPNIAEKSKQLTGLPNIIDVSSHHDPQEVLLVSDALITDYSSIMFDFMLTGRPGFLYANDIKDYMRDRNFYYDISEIPYALATNNHELSQNVTNFDVKKQDEAIKHFFGKLGVVANGAASAAVVDRIEEWTRQGAD